MILKLYLLREYSFRTQKIWKNGCKNKSRNNLPLLVYNMEVEWMIAFKRHYEDTKNWGDGQVSWIRFFNEFIVLCIWKSVDWKILIDGGSIEFFLWKASNGRIQVWKRSDIAGFCSKTYWKRWNSVFVGYGLSIFSS